MTSLIGWLVLKTGVPRKAILALAAAVAIAALVVGWRLWLSDHDQAVVDNHETGIALQVQTQGRAADQNMMSRQRADEAAIAKEREEFNNATSHLPKRGLTARQRIDACDQLRRQGTDPSILARAGCL